MPESIALKDRERLIRIHVVAFPALLQMRWNRNWFSEGVPAYRYPTMFMGMEVRRIVYWRWLWWKIKFCALYACGRSRSRYHRYPKV